MFCMYVSTGYLSIHIPVNWFVWQILLGSAKLPRHDSPNCASHLVLQFFFSSHCFVQKSCIQHDARNCCQSHLHYSCATLRDNLAYWDYSPSAYQVWTHNGIPHAASLDYHDLARVVSWRFSTFWYDFFAITKMLTPQALWHFSQQTGLSYFWLPMCTYPSWCGEFGLAVWEQGEGLHSRWSRCYGAEKYSIST